MSTLIRINRDHDDSRRAWIIGHPCMTTREWSHLEGERRVVSRLQQTDTGVEWANKKHGDKKNQGVEQTGSGTRNFGSEIAAFRFKNSFSYLNPDDQPHPWAGDVVVRMLTGADTFEEVMMPLATLALDPILGGGQSLQLGYNIKAGYVQPHRVGEVRFLSMAAGPPGLAAMSIYGTTVGGDFSTHEDADHAEWYADLWDSADDEPQIGWTVRIDGRIDHGSSWVQAAEFEIVGPGGSAGGGRTAVEYPMTAHLAAMAAVIDAHADFTASFVAGARDSILVGWVGAAGADGVAGSPLRVVVVDPAADFVWLRGMYGVPATLSRLTIGGKPLLVDVAA